VQYFRVYETQGRGALHVHAPMVSDDGATAGGCRCAKLRALAIEHGFGHSLKWESDDGWQARSGSPRWLSGEVREAGGR